MIKSFKNQLAETIFNGLPLSQKQAKEFPQAFYAKARRQLYVLDAASQLEVLYFPPSNHFEALSGKRKGEYSIRIQGSPWRVVFKWDGANPYDVQIEDYH
jgi:proteic killer suppression protein